MAWSSLTGALLVDPYGRPLDDRLQVVLRAMVPRLRRDFPAIRDDVLITDVLEQAGRSIVEGIAV